MVSIRDVAKHAGVAISTVSKVLNHYPNVSEETKKKVNAAIEELGFVPNSIASALSSKKSGRVALLLDVNRHIQTVDEIPMQYIVGAINRAKELELDVITVFFTMIQEMNVDEMVRYFQSQSIEGLVICGMSKQDTALHKLIHTGKFKVVLIDAPYVNDNTSCVHIDHTKAQYEVAKQIILANKCHRILYIAGKKNGYVSEERMQGMNELAKDLDLAMYTRVGNFSELQAREITLKYAKKKDAIICASDMMAIGAMKALTDMDIFRPVSGFDGISLMGYAGKQMHTVKQNFKEIASQAIDEVDKLMKGHTGQEIIVPYELIRMEYLDVIS